MRLGAPLLASILLAACAAQPERGLDVPPDAAVPARTATVLPPAEKPWHGGRVVVVRAYDELYKEDGEDRRRRVEELWDYGRGMAVRRWSTLDGKVLREEDDPRRVLRATEDELQEAFRRVREHPDLVRSASIPGAEWFGGFAYRKADDPYCDAGSRCVHVMVTLDHGLRRVIHAIVDLQSDRVVHPLYDPELTRPVSDADPYPEPAS